MGFILELETEGETYGRTSSHRGNAGVHSTDSGMAKDSFQDSIAIALETAKSEVKQLIAERQRVDIRIAHLSRAIASMSVVCNVAAPEYASLPPLRLTDSCHAVVAASDRAMSPKDIRDALIDSGYELGRYSNVLASIHTVLKRLAQSGRVQKIDAKEGALYAPLSTNRLNEPE